MKSNFLKKFLCALVLLVYFNAGLSLAAPKDADTAVVRYVVDGDTLILQDGRKVRLIGVDTPEIHDDQHRNRLHAARYGLNPAVVDEYAYQAKKFARQSVLHEPVRVEYDWEKRDKFGRTLAYIYRRSDGFFLNAELVRQGYGFAYTRFLFKYDKEFRAYQAQARRSHTGLWR